MTWQTQLKGDSLSWLLEPDNPGVRYLALRDLLDLPPEDPDLVSARELAHQGGPISTILGAIHPEGYWEKPGQGYLPKYRSGVWSLILLAQLGASIEMDARIQQACDYMLDHSLSANGQFSSTGPPSGTVDCLQGNMCAAMFDLGVRDERLSAAWEWMARSLTGDGVAPFEDKSAPLRYYAGKCGPDFCCGANNKLACAWGAVKVMLAFGKLPVRERTTLIRSAIQRGVDFLFSVDPLEATYPNGWNDKPSGNWWKFGFPVFYVTDLLQNVEALVRLGYGHDPRLANALNYIRDAQDQDGRWSLDYNYTGKTWVDFGDKKVPNKWVTTRAIWVLKSTHRS
jgi:hypothetical protein